MPAPAMNTAGAGDPATEMYVLMTRLYPICRSITGEGLRETLRIIREHVPLEIREVPTGTAVFDWEIPKEWNIRDAYIKTASGEKVVDFRDSNLHVVNYSLPVRGTFSLAELRPHLHSLPEHPDWIPYRTTYYAEQWGFCLPHTRLRALREGDYDVCIDSSLDEGHLSYGELVIPGRTADEVLISTHVCHPSMCNDNLSGIVVATFLARRLAMEPRRYTYRFLFVPGTIGAITWLSVNEARTAAVKHGLVLACLGDRGGFTYKRSRRGDAEIDRAVSHVLRSAHPGHRIVDFSPDGYDERQYCSPGFNLPVGSLSRTPHGQFAEYHTSADDLEFVRPEQLAGSLDLLLEVVAVLEGNQTYRNTNLKGEPRLGKRGLYRATGGRIERAPGELAMLWILNLSDGSHSLLDIAERSSLPFGALQGAAGALHAAGLLQELSR
jgi:aminopeptidase-like protein